MKENSITITFVGDMLCDARITELAGGASGFGPLFNRASKLKNCDYLVGNLETPVAGEELKYTYERYCFNTPDGYLEALKECGFQMLSLANNHCMDRGEEGILRTLQACKAYGFDTVGLYASQEDRDALFIKEIGGIKVAFLNYTYGTNAFAHHRFLEHPYMVNLLQPEETKPGSIHLLNSYDTIAADLQRIYQEQGEEYTLAAPYLEQLKSDITKAKQEADYVIMLLHCGGQYVQAVDPYTKWIAEKIREFGADLIVGNHQHVLQSCEETDGVLKIFCQGNFMYDQRIQLENGYFEVPLFNAVVHLTLSKDENGKISAEKSFSIYTTANDAIGFPCAIDSYDVYRVFDETYLERQILQCANLFAGKNRYTKVQERYEL